MIFREVMKDMQRYGMPVRSEVGQHMNMFFMNNTFRRLVTTVYKHKRTTLTPAKMIKWDLFMILVLLYSLFVTPYLLAFEDLSENVVYYAIEIILCGLFFIDMILQFFTAFYDDTNELVTDQRRIAVNYLKSYFFFDMIATFPLFVFEKDDNIGHAGSLLRISRLTRILYIFRAMKFFKMKKIFGTGSSLSFQVKYRGVINVLLFLSIAVIILHFSACWWYYFARIS